MNARLLPEVLSRKAGTPQQELPLATADVLRYVWESRYGPMLIEVRDGRVYVNGDWVEPAESGAGSREATP